MAASLLTTKEVADYLKVPVGTLYRWRYLGTGPNASVVGRHLRYRQTDVDTWVEKQQQS